MQNPILSLIRKVTRKDFFSLFGFVFKMLSPSFVKKFLIFLLKDRVFESYENTDQSLRVDVFGSSFNNPIGLAAGFDDEVEVVDELCHMGLGFGELGTFTLRGSEENFQSTKFFRKQSAIFYRNNGYHNLTCKQASPKLALRRGKKNLVGVSLGEDQHSKDPVEDIVKCIPSVAPYADYLVVNLSCPDYLGAKILQNELKLHDLVKRAKEVIKIAVPLKPCPLLVKVPYDIPVDAKRVLVERCLSCGIDGLVVSGPLLKVPEGVILREADYGGFFAGQPVGEDVNNLIKEYYYLSNGRLPIIATGGVFSGKDAYKRIRAGASLVQVYSVLLYKGPEYIPTMIKELAECLKADGFNSIEDAIGADLKKA